MLADLVRPDQNVPGPILLMGTIFLVSVIVIIGCESGRGQPPSVIMNTFNL